MLSRPTELPAVPLELALLLLVLTCALFLKKSRRTHPLAVACALLTVHAGGLALSSQGLFGDQSQVAQVRSGQ